MAFVPPVVTQEVGTPAVVQAGATIAENLNAAATRKVQAELALQELAIKQKLADQQLKVEVQEREKDRAAQEASEAKTRDANMRAQAAELAARKQHQDQLYSLQVKTMEEEKQLRQQAIAERRNALKSSNEISKQYKSKAEELTKKSIENQNKIAALEVQNRVAQGNEVDLAKLAEREGQDFNNSRRELGERGMAETTKALESVFSDEVMNAVSGVKGLLQRGAKNIGVEDSWLKYVPPIGYGVGPWSEILKQGYRSTVNVLGGDAGFDPTAMNTEGILIDRLSENLSGRLAAATGADSSALKNNLAELLVYGTQAARAFKSDGSIQGQNEEETVANFEKAALKVQELIGPEQLQGVIKGLESIAAVEQGTRPSKDGELRSGERKAIKQTLQTFSSISDVYEYRRANEGSPLSGLRYDQGVDDFVPMLLEATAKTSFGSQEFLAQAKKLGFSKQKIEAYVKKVNSVTKGGPTLPTVTKMLQDADKESKSLEMESLLLEREMGATLGEHQYENFLDVYGAQ